MRVVGALASASFAGDGAAGSRVGGERGAGFSSSSVAMRSGLRRLLASRRVVATPRPLHLASSFFPTGASVSAPRWRSFASGASARAEDGARPRQPPRSRSTAARASASRERGSAFSAARSSTRVVSKSSPAASAAAEERLAAADGGAKERTLVIVESPAKATSVQKYLGQSYQVLASYGHVRDLVEKQGSVLPDDGFAMRWSLQGKSGVVKSIVESAERCGGGVVLATDPDREGEAIAWHISELLKERGSRKKKDAPTAISRVTFTEVTRDAVVKAFKEPREISVELVHAYLARRALDYLFGFKLSGVLWRKIPSSERLSAGRVQSAALRLICEREMSIERHVKEEYWSVVAGLERASGVKKSDGDASGRFVAELHRDASGARLAKGAVNSKQIAEAVSNEILAAKDTLYVATVEEKEATTKPKPPFTTSTLQQEANAKLGFGSARTMSAAQKLYEGKGFGEGLITYMRTDGLHVGPDAVKAIRAVATEEFGASYVPATPNAYKKTQKNAQEAHEAIRPIRAELLPNAVSARLGANSDEARLYKLIWSRTMASQMSRAVTRRIAAEVKSASEGCELALKANGSRLLFSGFLAAYAHGGRTSGDDDRDKRDAWLPELKPGDTINLRAPQSVRVIERDKDAKRGGLAKKKSDQADDEDAVDVSETLSSVDTSAGITALQHWTQPPARYTEGALVRAMEEKGIGRPSTYASIVKVMLKRGYVVGGGGKGPLIPETRGRMVSSFLTHFFDEYVDYGFTAGLEDKLDDIASGDAEWKDVMSKFWKPFHGDVQGLQNIRTSLVVDVLDATLGAHFFGDDESETKARLDAIAATAEPPRSEGDAAAPKRAGDAWKSPDYDPATLRASRRCPACVDGRLGLKLSKNGGFIGCSNYNTDTKCAYARPISTTNGDDAESMRTDPWLSDGEIGVDPETSRTVSVRRGPYGPYVQLDPTANEGTPRTFGLQNVPEVTADKLTLNVALALLKYPMTLGVHPTEGGDVTMKIGPYGWYVNHGDVNAHIPAKTLKRVRDDARAAAMMDEPYEDKSDDFAFEHADAEEEEEEEGEMDAEELESAKLDGLGLERASPTKTTTSEERDAVFLARFAPIPLDVAVELITERKNNPRTGRGFRGRAKKDKEVASASATKGRTSKTKAAATPKPKPEPKPKRTRAPSAFFLYSAEKRPTLEPWLRAPEQAKILGAGWKALGDDERSRYEREARDAKAKMPADDAAAAKREKKKSTRTPSAYVLFCAEERANLPPGLSGPGQMKLLGAKWKEIDAVSRARFEVAAADAKDAAAAAAA